jgi:hemerythrin-like domain-containing protein
MTAEHREIARLTDQLEQLADDLGRAGDGGRERSIRSVLRDLRSAMDRHFGEEETVCFRLLSSELGPEEARSLYEAMEAAAADLRRLYE